jgi:hypothetical protein
MGESRCALCESAEASKVFPCLGCETPYHEKCVAQRGCAHPGCALEGLRGRHVLPRDALLWPVGRFLWMVTLACVVATFLRAQGAHAVSHDTLQILTVGVVAAALSFTSLAYLRDLTHPAGRLLAAEIVGRVLALCAGICWIFSIPQRTDTLVGVGFALLVCGIVVTWFRRGRKTHHPLRHEGMPEIAVGLVCAWFLAAAVLFFLIFGSGSKRGERANSRACYANQKTLAGALEMYNVDRKSRLPFDPALYGPFKSGGYLQSIPQDPGQGYGTSGNYKATDSINGITCRVHGSIQ